jgi:hypothetical protein
MIQAGRQTMVRRALGLSLLWATLGCSADGPEIVPVSGQVLLDGTPVTEGIVSFISPSGFGASAPLQRDGRFQLTSQYGGGIPAEIYQVAIIPPPPPMTAAAMEGQAVAANSPIPEHYRDFAQSGLTADTRSESKFTFHLHAR